MAVFRRPVTRALMLGTTVLALAACEGGFDLDLRSAGGGFDTTDAARTATERRPDPDDRGVISYPNFQVAVARRGDTVTDVANRVGIDAAELARYNGLPLETPLRAGEVVALPGRVAEPSPETGADGVGPIRPSGEIDITTLAGDALDRADSSRTPFETRQPPVQTGREPIQHQVKRGETAYSISRLYGVSVRSLADWNGLGPSLGVREGQFLLIPVAVEPDRVATAPVDTTAPGEGSLTPEPPSASQPLPDPEVAVVETPTSPNLAEDRTAVSGTPKMQLPVSGPIIRGYEKGRTDGIDIAANAGTPVKAADDGEVAAITRSTDDVPILVLRHAGNLLTVYANIDNINYEKGEKVSRGQTIAQVRAGNPSFLHFEVRRGYDSVDPVPFVN